jgi:hypothetical protein
MLDEILKKYCVQKVGIIQYAEMIMSRQGFVSAVNELNAAGCHICDITWWKHRKIEDESDNISMGGPLDEKDKGYYWAETVIDGKDFEATDLSKNKEEVLVYYKNFIKDDKHDLYPAITIVAN